MSGSRARPLGVVGSLVLTWALGGVTAILAFAILRLSPRVAEAFALDLGRRHYAFAVVFTLFMLYTEAWRGFHKKFSPRTVSRALHLASKGRLLHRVLAPVFAMGYFHASKRRIIATWILTFVIVGFVLAFRLLEQPWRGLADLGVVFGLGAGVLTLYIEAWRVARGGSPVDPELP